MNNEDLRLVEAWLDAAKDLEIEVLSPFQITDIDGQIYEYIALVKKFGSQNGMLICSKNLCPSGNSKESDYCLSILSSSYSPYRRDEYISMIRDWGWAGEKTNKPKWLECTT